MLCSHDGFTPLPIGETAPRRGSRFLAAVVLAGLGLGVLAGAAGAETLRWSRSADALTLDPHAQNDGVSHTILRQIYETLVSRDASGTLEPLLATEWFVKEGDPNIWVFKIREGVKFHDGADLTAEDVVFSLNRVRSELSKLRQLHADVEGVTAVDDHTVEVRLRGPNLIYPNNLTGSYILDKGWAEANNVVEVQDYAAGKDNHAVRNTNGTGPYVLKGREVGVRTTLTFNPAYWAEEKPQVTEVQFLPISDNATRVAALLSGEVDFVHDVPVQDIQRLQNAPGVTVLTGPENRNIFLGYRLDDAPLKSSNVTDRNPFADPKVREAVHLAVDRDAIVKVVLRGNGTPTGVAVPPFVNGWTQELSAYEPQDIARAKDLLAEAGYPDGFTVTLDTPNNRYLNDEAVSQAIVGFLGQIGIKATLASRPYAQHSPLIVNAQTDLYLFGWGVPTFDSAYNFNDLWHRREGRYGAFNPSGYANPALDAKIEGLGTETDPEKRNAAIAEIWDVVKGERLVLPLHDQSIAWALRDGFEADIRADNSPRAFDFRVSR
ncbi:ABC transporter substrate-binding protein [Paenirhodobacter sp.]|uniref:ABC transporter substrate-binding protein n=1 Tax=Paenirhodobacter sp. TaxID=1965326 RepID=UPI003B412CC3